MFQGFKASKSSTIDIIINFVTKTSVVTGTSEDITFRTKVCLFPEDTLASTLEYLKQRSTAYGVKEQEWTLIAYQGDKAVILEENVPVRDFKLNQGAREVLSLYPPLSLSLLFTFSLSHVFLARCVYVI